MALNRVEAIKRFRKAHGDKYKYDNFIFTDQHTLSLITCKTHGDYSTTPITHWNGGGECRKCKFDNKQKNILKIFNERFKDNYEFISFIDTNKILLRCKKHNINFTIWENNFKKASSHPCRFCIGENKNQARRNSLIKDFIKIHGDRYDYSKVEYINADHKIIIICKLHGEFLILASNHLKGVNCSKCSCGTPSKAENDWIKKIEELTNIKASRNLQFSTNIKNSKVKLDSAFNNIAIEYDGSYWHSFFYSYQKDLQKNEILIKNGFKVIRLREISSKLCLLDIPNCINLSVTSNPNDKVNESALKYISSLILENKILC